MIDGGLAKADSDASYMDPGSSAAYNSAHPAGPAVESGYFMNAKPAFDPVVHGNRINRRR